MADRRSRLLAGLGILAIAATGAAWSGCGGDDAEDEARETADEIEKEAQEGIDKAKDEADKAQDEIDKALEDAGY
jgi:hypothetical protein